MRLLIFFFKGKIMKSIVLIFALSAIAVSGERNVLVEMFTNSHCSVCPGAHSAINAYAATSSNAARVRYIYYHTTFPYSDDQLSLANTTEPNARNTYYNGPTSTPNTFFDGTNQGRTYSSFAANLDARMSISSPLEIKLIGSKKQDSVSIAAVITQSAVIAQTDLVIHFVLVEDVTYTGRNGVSPQNYVMRKMLTPPGGESFTPELNSTKLVLKNNVTANVTDKNKMGVVVFIQSASTKEIFQSEYIASSALLGVEDHTVTSPSDFTLHQNYPNPFNPSTAISFSLPRAGFVSLKVYDLLGKEVATIVSGSLLSGPHTYRFSAREHQLSSGIYFYSLEAGGRTFVRKMLLLQ